MAGNTINFLNQDLDEWGAEDADPHLWLWRHYKKKTHFCVAHWHEIIVKIRIVEITTDWLTDKIYNETNLSLLFKLRNAEVCVE